MEATATAAAVENVTPTETPEPTMTDDEAALARGAAGSSPCRRLCRYLGHAAARPR